MFGPSKQTLFRTLERDREQFMALIREQNDRIMELAGKPWTLPPRPTTPEPVAKADDDDFEEI